MTTTAAFRPGKPHPLIRFNNWLGERKRGREKPWRTLDEEALLRRARQLVKEDDFGSDEFREPLRVLLKACREEGRLSYFGRGVVTDVVLHILCNRLRIQRELTAHPEILDQPVKRPLIVLGAPRTGTTLLNYLLSQDPAGRPLLGWESGTPAPLQAGGKRGAKPWDIIVRAVVQERIIKAVLPDIGRMHPFGWKTPDECHWLVFPSFVIAAAMVLPSFHAWMVSQPASVYELAYADYRRALQLLEWHRPASGHWVLKSPLHLWSLDAIAHAVPEACFVQTHRTLDQVLPSMCSLAAVLMSIVSDAVEPAKMGPTAMQLTRDTLARFTRARRTLPASRILDLSYPELIGDPVAAVKKVYRAHDYEYTPEYDRRLKAYLSRNRRGGPARHLYRLDQFGLSREAVLEEFHEYHQAFGLV